MPALKLTLTKHEQHRATQVEQAIRSQIATQLRAWRQQSKWPTQSAFARRLGVNQSRVCHIEHLTTRRAAGVSLANLAKMASVLGADIVVQFVHPESTHKGKGRNR